jgi:hypothetical protein
VFVFGVDLEHQPTGAEDLRRRSERTTALLVNLPTMPPLLTTRRQPTIQTHRPTTSINNVYPSPKSPSHSDFTSPTSSTCHTPSTPGIPNLVHTKSVAQNLPTKPPVINAQQYKLSRQGPLLSPVPRVWVAKHHLHTQLLQYGRFPVNNTTISPFLSVASLIAAYRRAFILPCISLYSIASSSSVSGISTHPSVAVPCPANPSRSI